MLLMHAFRVDRRCTRCSSSHVPWYRGCSLNWLLASMPQHTSEAAGSFVVGMCAHFIENERTSSMDICHVGAVCFFRLQSVDQCVSCSVPTSRHASALPSRPQYQRFEVSLLGENDDLTNCMTPQLDPERRRTKSNSRRVNNKEFDHQIRCRQGCETLQELLRHREQFSRPKLR